MNLEGMTLVSIVIFIDGVDKNGARLWMQVREVPGPLHGLWEFPGGKIEKGETPAQAAAREVQEEVGIHLESPPVFFKFHPYTNINGKKIGLYVFLARHSALPQTKNQRWFVLDFVKGSAPLQGQIPPVNHAIIDEVLEYVSRQFNGEAWEMVWA
jgi:8-oxo-dGTP diphosphatase